ncbi:type II secretion system F family protein [Oricola cellulosilytica]|uniref:Type II secretion system F family protein n=1 Tax=Oricola cellulosilytica TaxID=1429082 RepID=A0A4R0PEF3_9HYPH|nr:type II secretion system F family protein [Oricola cellulosilytica]TCD16185.1 type II secretion system F family protein [Oricola cellulosilytica]
MNETLILTATFTSVLIFSVALLLTIGTRREVSQRLHAQKLSRSEYAADISEDIRGLPVSEQELVRHYFNVVRSDNDPNSLQNRLIRAGYFAREAVYVFHLIRIAATVIVFVAIFFAVRTVSPETSILAATITGLVFSGVTFILCNVVLERMGVRKEIQYRKDFPDFMDTLIVCIDAGLSVEAAIDRVSRDFLKSKKRGFGLHLAIMMLEVRGGRRLRDALSNFARRLQIEEAQALAVLFRQSEELGSSVTQTLRVFSEEMRQKRMIRAEEKANLLPLKMLIPLSLFLFPVSILIVVVPILITVVQMLIRISNPAG